MARSVKKYLKISKGQISKNLVERTDIGILDDSGQEITNFYDTKYGALQTVAGTEFMFNFGEDAKVKLHTIHLSDNKEATLAFDATNQKLYLFDYQGNQLDQISFPYITESNYERSNIAQQEDLILLATGDNPLIQINTTNNKLGFNIYSIEAKNILKVSNLVGDPSSYLLYSKDTSGNYSITVSREEEIIIRISGAGGGKFYGDVPSGVQFCLATNGEYYEYSYTAKVGDVISGTLGAHGLSSAPPNAGSGYNNGYDGAYSSDGKRAGGGGGGSSSLFINGVLIYEASGGRGSNIGTGELGGAGGGPLGASDNTGRSSGAKGYKYQYVYNTAAGDWEWQETLAEDGFIEVIRTSIPVGEDIVMPTTKFTNSATAGVVSISALPNTATGGDGTLFFVKAPNEELDVEKYARSIVIGTNFDSESAIGVVKITDIKGSVVGQQFNISKITGPTIVGFDKVYHKADEDAGIKEDLATGFKITTSMVPAFSGDLPNTDNNPTEYKNYPNLITFYQQRLIIFGTAYNAEQVLLSNVGEYNNFTDDYLSTSAFQLVIGSDQKESIRAFCLNQGIQIFTNVSEWLIDAQTITRTTGFVRNSQMGTNGVKPIISANGTTLFCPKNGKGIIGFIYNEQSASYMTPYISMFTDLLDVEIRDLFLKRGRDSQDDTLLYICDANGNLIIGNYLQDHNIQGFCRRSATGVKFLQSVQNEENVLLLSSRAGYTTLERIDQSKKTAHSTSLFQYNQETGVITLELPQYQNTLLNVYDETGEFVDSYTVSPEKELYEWTYDRMVCRTDVQLATGNLIYFGSKIVGKVETYIPGLDNIEWYRFGYCWEHENERFYTTTDTPVVGDIATNTTGFTGEITEVGLDYIKVSYLDTEYICYRNVSRDGVTNVLSVNQQISDMEIVPVSTIGIPEGKRPQGISEIGYNIHQVFHSNPMNIGAITMTEYKSIARIDLALTSESRHDALTINKKYGRRKGNLVSYIRPQRPTRDCTFTIENDVYPVEILSMEVEIEY